MGRQQSLHWRQCAGAGFHHIMSAPPMNVHVDKAGRQDAVGKVNQASIFWDFPARPRGHFNDASVVNQKQGLLDPLQRCE
jgi:hypothetical protein